MIEKFPLQATQIRKLQDVALKEAVDTDDLHVWMRDTSTNPVLTEAAGKGMIKRIRMHLKPYLADEKRRLFNNSMNSPASHVDEYDYTQQIHDRDQLSSEIEMQEM